MVMGCDWFPTIAEYCETSSPLSELDGKSIAFVIKSSEAASPHQHLYWQLGTGPKAQWVVRQNEWKLLGNPQDRSKQGKLDPEKDQRYLVNLDADISETTNLAHDQSEKVNALQAIRDRYEKALRH